MTRKVNALDGMLKKKRLPPKDEHLVWDNNQLAREGLPFSISRSGE